MEVLSYIYYLTEIAWRYSNVCLQWMTLLQCSRPWMQSAFGIHSMINGIIIVWFFLYFYMDSLYRHTGVFMVSEVVENKSNLRVSDL